MVAAPEKGPLAARLWRVAATCRSASQLAKEQQDAAAHGASWHSRGHAVMRRGRPSGPIAAQKELPQAQQKRLTQNRWGLPANSCRDRDLQIRCDGRAEN